MAATASEGTVDTTLVKRGSSITTCCHELVLLQYSHTRDFRRGLAGKPGLLRGCWALYAAVAGARYLTPGHSHEADDKLSR